MKKITTLCLTTVLLAWCLAVIQTPGANADKGAGTEPERAHIQGSPKLLNAIWSPDRSKFVVSIHMRTSAGEGVIKADDAYVVVDEIKYHCNHEDSFTTESQLIGSRHYLIELVFQTKRDGIPLKADRVRVVFNRTFNGREISFDQIVDVVSP
jgi:hypothetical protein